MELTDYEVEILQRVIAGRSWNSIATEFDRSRSAVRGAHANALRKIQLARAEGERPDSGRPGRTSASHVLD